MPASLKLFGVDLATVNWNFVIYTLLSIAIVAMGTAKLFSMGAPTGIIFAIGSAMIFIFYGYRWFGVDPKKKPDTWPPTLNTCPDYFTYIESLPGDKKPGCIDMLGVCSVNTIGITTQEQLAVQSGSGVISSTTAAKVFGFTSTDIKNGTDVRSICLSCKAKGITWEGVFDGDTCVGASPNSPANPKPAGSCSS
jgi:hypothetical protein